MSRLLPLFPLQLVVFPGSAVPLHIFEDRYREMVGEAEASGTEFGIVLATEGGIVNAGCTVVVEAVLKRYPDGRFDVMARGRRRFRISSLDHEKAYLRGEVEYFDDDDLAPVPPDLSAKVIEAFRILDDKPVDSGHPFLSFELARGIDDLDLRTRLQNTRSEAKRLRMLLDYLKEYVPKLEYAAKMKRVAPTNGAGHKPASL